MYKIQLTIAFLLVTITPLVFYFFVFYFLAFYFLTFLYVLFLILLIHSSQSDQFSFLLHYRK